MRKNNEEPYFPIDKILEKVTRRIDTRLSRGIGKQLFNENEKR